jgi:hypothetical protein
MRRGMRTSDGFTRRLSGGAGSFGQRFSNEVRLPVCSFDQSANVECHISIIWPFGRMSFFKDPIIWPFDEGLVHSNTTSVDMVSFPQ